MAIRHDDAAATGDGRAPVTIPRILVDVERRNGGWAVEVRRASRTGDQVLSPGHGMAAVAVTDADGWSRQVPVLPTGRRAGLGADLPPDLVALCTGDAAAISALLTRITGRDLDAGDATLYGRWLFACLLAPVWPAILAAAAGHGVELALRWPADDLALGALVWEAMHDGEAPLVGHPRVLVAMTRVVPAPTPAPATIRRLPRVLFAAGSALDDAVIRPGAVFMGLVRGFDAEGLCVSQAMTNVSLAELGEACARFGPDVVHLVAHGDVADGRAVVRLVDPAEPAGVRHVDAEALATALRGPSGMPTAVVLSACGTARPTGPGPTGGPTGGDGPTGGTVEVVDEARVAGRSIAAELTRRGVPVVVAMSGEVSEQASRMFTRGFVRAMQHGASVVGAAAAGRRAALLHGDPPSRYLDWAMPALFLAESVPPGLRIVDPAPAAWLRSVAEGLDLRREPMFIGHEAILTAADALADPAPERCPALLAAVTEGPLRGLGGSRLLREIGLRLLRLGHLPLLIGPFGDGGAPRDARDLSVRILQAVISVAEALGLTPPPLTTIAVDPTCDTAAGVTAEALAELGARERFDRLDTAVAAFATGISPLNPRVLRRALAADLTALARAAATGLAAPFGPSTRVVVLGDEVHRWVGALRPLLSMISRDGLGPPGHPVPVVVTASLLEDEGAVLRRLRDERAGQPGFVFPEITRMPPASAILGFQWVLLHPWLREYPQVYTAARSSSRVAIEKSLGELKGMPTAVLQDLYLIANVLTFNDVFVAADDEGALRIYEERRR